MFRKLLEKEIKLCLSPINYIFLCSSLMILIPDYSCYVPFFYLCLSIYIIFVNSEFNFDINYSLTLPIKKTDIVKARCFLVAFYEFLEILICFLFAIFRIVFMEMENSSGIDANPAFFGLILVNLGIFNFIFFTSYYKNLKKPLLPFIWASLAFWIFYLLFELPILYKESLNISYLFILDSSKPDDFLFQLPVLIFGMIFYSFAWIFCYKVASKSFNKIDL